MHSDYMVSASAWRENVNNPSDVPHKNDAAQNNPLEVPQNENIRSVFRQTTMMEQETLLALNERDEYWQGRIRAELEVTKAKIEQNVRSSLHRQQSLYNDDTRKEVAELNKRCDKAESTVEQMTERISELEREKDALASELVAGKAIIEQFSKLMADKANGICQYCRRSGTLRPIPFT
eukprot:GEMP01037040.1.p1 GENE.GEMP01037040.1~~GEMP01037040.1.p1  ORF type:complete len:178 (+),score=36.05 GEMP01037040.1:101-634(+)